MKARSILLPLVCLVLGLGSPKAKAFETVVVDPGHGGNDEGTRWYHISEKDLSLAVAQRVSALLRAKGINVVQTRLDDRYVSLDERAEIANRTRNSLLVSIHFNASSATSASGFQTHYFFASPSGQIIANSIQTALAEKLTARSRGIMRKDYAVLARTNDCAVLVECGFLSNKPEAIYYATSDGQQALAEAIAAGILRVKPVINNDPSDCEDAKCQIYAMKAVAAERKLTLSGRHDHESVSGEPHTGLEARPQIAGLFRPVKDILAEIEDRLGGE